MKSIKTNLVLLVTIIAVTLSGCEKEKTVEPVIEREELRSPEDQKIPKIIVKPAIPAKDYRQIVKEMVAEGYRLIFIDGFLHTEGNSTQTETINYFNAIFEENPDKISWASFHGLTSSTYQSKFDEYTSKGFRLTHIESYPQNGGIRYAPIFAKITGPDYLAYHGIKIQDHQSKFDDLVAKGYRLTNRSIVEVGEQKYVTALYDKKDVGSWVSKSGLDEGEVQNMMTANFKNGKKLGVLDISQTSSSKFTYGPVFDSEPHNGWYALHKLNIDELINEIADAESLGYRTNIVVGYDEPGPVNGNEVYNLRFTASWIK